MKKSSQPCVDFVSIAETGVLQQDLQVLVENTYRRGYQAGITEALVQLARVVETETELEVQLALFEPAKPISFVN